jgi:hypothetical protein
MPSCLVTHNAAPGQETTHVLFFQDTTCCKNLITHTAHGKETMQSRVIFTGRIQKVVSYCSLSYNVCLRIGKTHKTQKICMLHGEDKVPLFSSYKDKTAFSLANEDSIFVFR